MVTSGTKNHASALAVVKSNGCPWVDTVVDGTEPVVLDVIQADIDGAVPRFLEEEDVEG